MDVSITTLIYTYNIMAVKIYIVLIVVLLVVLSLGRRVAKSIVATDVYPPTQYLWDAQTGTCWVFIGNFEGSGLSEEECY